MNYLSVDKGTTQFKRTCHFVSPEFQLTSESLFTNIKDYS